MKAVTVGSDLASISSIDLADHDPEGRVGYVVVVEQHLDVVETVLPRDEADGVLP